ncbi:hypothetical protein PSPO01_15044 [Paraphaeosphaeria sporulosa]
MDDLTDLESMARTTTEGSGLASGYAGYRDRSPLYNLGDYDEETFAHFLKRSGSSLSRFLQRQLASRNGEKEKKHLGQSYIVQLVDRLMAANT